MAVTQSRLVTARLSHHLRSVGEGELVLFLHGITAGAAVWDPILADLGRQYRCFRSRRPARPAPWAKEASVRPTLDET